MICPACGGTDLRTLNTRATTVVDTPGTRRRRQCRTCQHRWTTLEVSESQLADLIRARAINRERMVKAHATRRGFHVPDELREEYFWLRDVKKLSATEAGQVLGILECKHPSPAVRKWKSRRELDRARKKRG